MADNRESRRLETPRVSRQSEGTRRSSNRTRCGSSGQHAYRSRSRSRHRTRSSTRERGRLRELSREQELLRNLEDEVRRQRNRLRSTEQRERDREHRSSTRRRRRRSRSNIRAQEQQQPVELSNAEASAQQLKRSDSPSFSTNDIGHLLNALRNSKSQTSTAAEPHYTNNVNHKNILPDFDPSSKNQRVDIWLKKVNECATVYGWDERTTIHFSMQKLQGLAKVWYEGLNSILYTWTEWQEKLHNAFQYEQNYGQSLEEMLKRRSRFTEPIEVYYYDKLALLNQCDIEGKRAVDCIIHGLNDKTLKLSALALRCSHPDQLLQFLISNKETSQSYDGSSYTTRSDFNTNANNAPNNKTGGKNLQNDNVFCFNCKEVGHPFLRCSKPLIRCSLCHRVGHKAENCRSKSEYQNIEDATVAKTMRISHSSPNSKFF